MQAKRRGRRTVHAGRRAGGDVTRRVVFRPARCGRPGKEHAKHYARVPPAFAHTLICGTQNGLFGYIGPDEEIERGGYETDSYWKMLYIDGFRLPLARGTTDKIIDCSLELLRRAQKNQHMTTSTTLRRPSRGIAEFYRREVGVVLSLIASSMPMLISQRLGATMC